MLLTITDNGVIEVKIVSTTKVNDQIFLSGLLSKANIKVEAYGTSSEVRVLTDMGCSHRESIIVIGKSSRNC